MFILDNFGVGLLTFRFRICTRAGTPLEAFLACGLIARSAMDVKKLRVYSFSDQQNPDVGIGDAGAVALAEALEALVLPGRGLHQ